MFKFNLPYLKKWSRTTFNPGADNNYYDNQIPLNWDIDAFSSWFINNAVDHANTTNSFTEKVFGLPKGQKLTVLFSTSDGTGLNNNRYWERFGSVKGALYDVWTYLKPKLGSPSGVKAESIEIVESIVRKILRESPTESKSFAARFYTIKKNLGSSFYGPKNNLRDGDVVIAFDPLPKIDPRGAYTFVETDTQHSVLKADLVPLGKRFQLDWQRKRYQTANQEKLEMLNVLRNTWKQKYG